MNSKEVKTVKGLVKDLRTIRDKMNAELEKMNAEERSIFFRQLKARNHSPQQTT